MSEDPPTPIGDPEASIADKRERVEAIVEQLEDGTVSLERATELHEEGLALLEELRDELDLQDGSVELRD